MTYAQFADLSTDFLSAFGFQCPFPFAANWLDNFSPLTNFLLQTVFFSVWSGHTILLVVLLYERSIPPDFLCSLVPDCYLCFSFVNHFERIRTEVSTKLVRISVAQCRRSVGTWALHLYVHRHRLCPSTYSTNRGLHLLLSALLRFLFLTLALRPHLPTKHQVGGCGTCGCLRRGFVHGQLSNQLCPPILPFNAMNGSGVQPRCLLEATVVSSCDAQLHVFVQMTDGDDYQSSGKTEHQSWQT